MRVKLKIENGQKRCPKCGLSKDLSLFSVNNRSVHKLASWCKECKHDYNIIKTDHRKEYRRNNATQISITNKLYREKNIEARQKYDHDYYEKNKKRKNLYIKEKYKTDINFKISCNLRRSIRRALKNISILKHEKSSEYLGCSLDVFRNYLKSMFTNNMSWDDFLSGKIHIDHIRPCALFNMDDFEERKKCFHYTNLQPLWAMDNYKKGIKY